MSLSDEETCSMTKTYTWSVRRLWKLAAELTPFEKSLESFEEWLTWPWEEPDLHGFMDHMDRIMGADLSHPVILSDEGWVMDGVHRLLKARLEGRKTITVVQFDKTPEPDAVTVGETEP